MQTRRLAKSDEKVCREDWCQRHPRSPRTLWSRPKMRVSSWCDEASICCASSRTSSPPAVRRVARRQFFEHLRPEAVPRAGRCVAARSRGSLRGARPQPALTSARGGKKVANVIPVDHGAIQHRGVRFQSPNSSYNSTCGGHHITCRRARPNSERRNLIVAAAVNSCTGSISQHDVRASHSPPVSSEPGS